MNPVNLAVQPELPLELYEMENCPYCRVVREALTELDLDAMIYPCPKRGERFRPTVVEMGGKAQFPFLVDPNTSTQMYESADIIQYLYETYGERSAPSLRLRLLDTPKAMFASAVRAGRGMRARASHAPDEPLELFSFEASPYARVVRECLCELEIPYVVRNMGRTQLSDWLLPAVRKRLIPDIEFSGRNRAALREREGRVQSPYLYDPNTGRGVFESDDIIEYLRSHYGAL